MIALHSFHISGIGIRFGYIQKEPVNFRQSWLHLIFCRSEPLCSLMLFFNCSEIHKGNATSKFTSWNHRLVLFSTFSQLSSILSVNVLNKIVLMRIRVYCDLIWGPCRKYIAGGGRRSEKLPFCNGKWKISHSFRGRVYEIFIFRSDIQYFLHGLLVPCSLKWRQVDIERMERIFCSKGKKKGKLCSYVFRVFFLIFENKNWKMIKIWYSINRDKDPQSFFLLSASLISECPFFFRKMQQICSKYPAIK